VPPLRGSGAISQHYLGLTPWANDFARFEGGTPSGQPAGCRRYKEKRGKLDLPR